MSRWAKASLAKLHAEWAAKVNGLRSDAQRHVASTKSSHTVDQGAGRDEPTEAADSNPTLVLNFLAKHPDKAFTPEEVAEQIGRLDRVSSIRTTMLRLHSTAQIDKLGRGLYKCLPMTQ